MTRRRGSHIAAPLALLVISQAAFAENDLDLKETDARNAAYVIMKAAEARFDCKLEEHSMRAIGNEPGARYLVYVTAEGEECRQALIFVANTAAKDHMLLVREVEDRSEPIVDPVILFSEPSIGGDQVLIHEVNPPDGKEQ